MGKIKYGLSNCYYAVATDDGNGNLTYANPVRLPGAVSLTMDAQGDKVEDYADDTIWFSNNINNGYSGTLELQEIPDAFRKDVLGEIQATDGGYYEVSKAQNKEFALLGQFAFNGGTATGKRFCFFRCSASRPSVSGTTKGSNIEAQHESMTITAMARVSDDKVKFTAVSTDSCYSTFFSAVPAPTAAQ